MADPRSPATVVLVHGAFHGAWCWERVVPLLEARGVPVVAIDLPGHGGDRAAPGDLYSHADALHAVLEGLDGPVVVVGHSYGGAVISDGASGVPAVAHLVYLAALVADAGETVAAVMPGAVADGEDVSQVSGAMGADADGFLVIDPQRAGSAFYADCSPEDVEFAVARLSPQNPATFAQPLRAAAWRTVPSTYVVCSEDRAVSVAFQRALATRTTDRVEMSTSHSPFFSAPKVLADLLADIAERAAR